MFHFFTTQLSEVLTFKSAYKVITACIALNYIVILCRNKAVKRIWTLIITVQTAAPYVPFVELLGTLAFYDVTVDPNNYFFSFSSSSLFLRRPGVCGTINVTHKGKWVPCVWWKAALAVTQYNYGGITPRIHLLTLGGKAIELELLSPSLCHFALLSRPSLSQICRHTADSCRFQW